MMFKKFHPIFFLRKYFTVFVFVTDITGFSINTNVKSFKVLVKIPLITVKVIFNLYGVVTMVKWIPGGFPFRNFC